MIIDRDLLFSNAQAVTATAASTDVVDLAPLGLATSAGGTAANSNLGRQIGKGEELYIFISVDTLMADSGSDATVAVTLETDDNSSFSTAATIATLVTIPAVQPAGTRYLLRLPMGSTVPYERYIQLRYTVANGPLTAGAFSAGIVKDADSMMPTSDTYVGGYTNAAG